MQDYSPALITGFIVGAVTSSIIVALILAVVYYIVFKYLFNHNTSVLGALYAQQMGMMQTQLNILFQQYLACLGFKAEMNGTIFVDDEDDGEEDEEDEPRRY